MVRPVDVFFMSATHNLQKNAQHSKLVTPCFLLGPNKINGVFPVHDRVKIIGPTQDNFITIVNKIISKCDLLKTTGNLHNKHPVLLSLNDL